MAIANTINSVNHLPYTVFSILGLIDVHLGNWLMGCHLVPLECVGIGISSGQTVMNTHHWQNAKAQDISTTNTTVSQPA